MASPRPPRAQFFAWKCLHDIVPTRERLQREIPITDNKCGLYSKLEETLHYLLFTYPYTRAVWLGISWGLRIAII